MTKKTPETYSPKYFFLHLLLMITLYVSAISFMIITFQIINIVIPDVLDPGYEVGFAKERLRGGLSFFAVMLPVFVGIAKYLKKEYKKNSALREMRSRKWLVYFTMFAATLIILISFGILVNVLLGGELTIRFLFKLLSVLFVAGSVGWYFYTTNKE